MEKSRQLESLRTCTTTERNGDINGPIIMGTPQEDTCIGKCRWREHVNINRHKLVTISEIVWEISILRYSE
jgi:hypothetical protein